MVHTEVKRLFPVLAIVLCGCASAPVAKVEGGWEKLPDLPRVCIGSAASVNDNLFIVTGPQGGGGSFNFIDAIDSHGDYVVWMLSELRDRGEHVVDVAAEWEERYAEHCRQADAATAPLRDCLSNFNRYGQAAPGSLGYYGGRQWHRRRDQAQATLEPYVFS